MSDYERAAWLKLRTIRNQEREHRPLRYLIQVPASGKNRDPANIDRHRRLRGPLIRATGAGCYDEWKLQAWRERREKRGEL
jgi:hypothetical protein